MKVLKLIPKKIKEIYQITKQENCIEIYSPAYVNIDFDVAFIIGKDKFTIFIKNNRCNVSLWKKVKKMHITIY